MKFHLSIAFPSIRHTLNFCEQDRESAIIELSLIKKIESLPFIIFTKIKARKWQILWQWLHKRKKHENVLAGISCSNLIFHNSLFSIDIAKMNWVSVREQVQGRKKELIWGSELRNSRCCLHKWIYEFIFIKLIE